MSISTILPCFESTALPEPFFAKLNLMLGVFMVAEGVIFAIVAFILFRKKSAQLRRCQKTTGDIIEVREHDSGGTVTKHPVIRYHTSYGAIHTFESKFGLSNWKFKPGDRVDILVDRDDPSKAEVVNWMAQWGAALVLGFVAIVTLIGAPLAYFLMRH